jgi:hypothetical protein
MRTTYAGVHPNVDLHHALLGGIHGGGIAYIGVVCRSDYGFGLTSGLSGTFQSMGETVLWDMKGFMHEVCLLWLYCYSRLISSICDSAFHLDFLQTDWSQLWKVRSIEASLSKRQI